MLFPPDRNLNLYGEASHPANAGVFWLAKEIQLYVWLAQFGTNVALLESLKSKWKAAPADQFAQALILAMQMLNWGAPKTKGSR